MSFALRVENRELRIAVKYLKEENDRLRSSINNPTVNGNHYLQGLKAENEGLWNSVGELVTEIQELKNKLTRANSRADMAEQNYESSLMYNESLKEELKEAIEGKSLEERIEALENSQRRVVYAYIGTTGIKEGY